jgi:hypothetical protein
MSNTKVNQGCDRPASSRSIDVSASGSVLMSAEQEDRVFACFGSRRAACFLSKNCTSGEQIVPRNS